MCSLSAEASLLEKGWEGDLSLNTNKTQLPTFPTLSFCDVRGGGHSTEAAFALLTQLSWVRISVLKFSEVAPSAA